MSHTSLRHSLRRCTFVLCTVLGANGCATTLVLPEADPMTAQTAYLVDYGRHASVVLPRDVSTEQFVEYNYGDYAWYAKNQDAWFNVLGTLFIPTTGTLGRRDLTIPGSVEVDTFFDAEQVFIIPADPADVDALRASLDDRYGASDGSDQVFNPRFGLHFVRDEESYWIGHNCNHETVEWLKSLGCRVQGPVMLADFKVKTR